MDDRLDRMQAAIDSLFESQANLQSRVRSLELAATAAPTEAPDAAPGAAPRGTSIEFPEAGPLLPAGVPLVRLLSVAGMAFLVLAGAFLLRSFTDAGYLAPTMGVALGVIYAVAWMVVADRAGAKGSMLTASFLGVVSVLIACPLLWEATTKLEALTPPVAAALLSGMTAITMWIAWRRRIHALAWAVTLATLASAGALLYATTAIEVFTLPVLLLGFITAWLAYSRGWGAMRWLSAGVLHVCVLLMVLLAGRTTDSPGRFDHLSVPFVQGIAAGMVVLYLASFAFHTLRRRGKAEAFEMLQTAGVLLTGLGGAVRVAGVGGAETLLLGAASIGAAAACYAVAFSFVDRRMGRGSLFSYYAWLALVLALLGSGILVPGAVLPHLWLVMAAAAAFLGGRYDRITLRSHCAVSATAAAWVAGLFGVGIQAFLAASPPAWPGTLWAVLAMVLLSYVLLVATQGGRHSRGLERLPRFVVLLVGVVGIGGLVVVLSTRVLPEVSSANLAMIRTAVISLSAIALAAAGRRKNLVEMSWLPYPLLVVGGLKLVIEDLRQGDAVTMFIAFACFGIALITAPRLHRKAETATEGEAGDATP